jgi:HK97 family phage prohead protease
MKKANLERRTVGAREVRAVTGDNGKGLAIEGTAAKYGVLSQDLGGFRERIARGAFRSVAQNSDTVCLFNHDQSKLLGRTTSGTLTLTDTNEGLNFRCSLPDTETARDVHSSISRGDITGCSFSFNVDPEDVDWSEESDPLDRAKRFACRTLKNIRQLFDVGPVLFPAYPAGTSVSARSLELMRNSRAGSLVIVPFKVPTNLRREEPESLENTYYENEAFEEMRQRRRRTLLNNLLNL